jgi:hypothetical protein
MQQVINVAIKNGMSRAQAYELMNRIVTLKKTKVYQELLKKNRTNSSWSDIESMVRRYQLSGDQYQTLKRNYFSYVP